MKQLIAGLFITLDGVTEEPSNWQDPEQFDDDMLAELEANIAATDTILMGRVTYDYWASYWPTATYEPFASHINQKPKYVASRSLTGVTWGDFNNIALLQGDTVEAIRQLKQQPGKHIAVTGSPTLVRFLLENDLLDELTLMIHPVVAGRGERLFDQDGLFQRLRLKSNTSSKSGIIIATYEPQRESEQPAS